MAHEIDMTTGRAAAAFARTPAWHKLGRVLPNAMTTAEAIREAGLEWTVGMRPLFWVDNKGQMKGVDDKRAVIRTDTDRVLGVVGGQYVPCQNADLTGFLDAVIGLGAKIESAGALHGGRKVWFLCSLGESFDVVPGDPVHPYALFMNGHDGTTRLRVVPTSVRVVCQNTLTLATDRETLGMTIRHDGRLNANIEQAREALGLVYTRSQRMEREAKALAAKQLRTDELSKFFVRQVEKLKFHKEREELVMQELAMLLESGTNTLPGIRGTAWAMYNAWSEWVDHAPRRTGADARLESIWTGEGHRQKAAAWEDALAV